MTDYRRANVPGACWFFTVNLAERKNNSLLTENIELLRDAIRYVRRRHPFMIDAMVILPDHIHAVWTLPEGDADFGRRWGLLKSYFSRRLPKSERMSKSRQSRGELGVWQRRFWEYLIRDDRDYATHMDYVHINPLKHGLVESVAEWPYSTFHRLVKRGVYLDDWAGNADVNLPPYID